MLIMDNELIEILFINDMRKSEMPKVPEEVVLQIDKKWRGELREENSEAYKRNEGEIIIATERGKCLWALSRWINHWTTSWKRN